MMPVLVTVLQALNFDASTGGSTASLKLLYCADAGTVSLKIAMPVPVAALQAIKV